MYTFAKPISRFISLLFCLILLGLPANTLADEGAEESGKSEAQGAPAVELPAEEVVASPIIEGNQVDRFGATTTVVTQEQIESLNAVDLPEALVRVPGVTISRHNHVGSFGGGEGGAVFIRGMGSSRPGSEIKTYVDDVPMYMGPWNHPLMDLLPVDAAQSIEVIKGPQPQRYGDTLSAVNMVPKRQQGDESTTTVKFSVGSYGTVSESVEHGGKIDDFDYYVGEGYIRSDGHRKDSWGSKLGYYVNLGYAINDLWDVRLIGLGATNRSSDPGPDTPTGVSDGTYGTNAQLVSVTLSNNYEYLDGHFKFFVNTGEGNWKDQAGADDDCLNDFTFYGLRLDETFHPWTGMDITLGLDQDWWQSKVHNTYDGGTDEIIDIPDYALTMPYIGASQLIGAKDSFYAIPSVGVRYYEHNRFDSESAPFGGLILGYRNTEAHVALSRGVVYPGQDLLAASWVLSNGWEDMEAELSDHLEVGLAHDFSGVVKLEATYFKDRGNNRYVFAFSPAAGGPVWYNSGRYEITGWEFTASAKPLDTLSLFAGLTLLDVNEPTDMPYAPETTFSAGFTWRFLDNFTLSMDGQYVDEMYVLSQGRMATAANTETVDGHFVLSGRLGWEFWSDLLDADCELYLAGENLLDNEYEYKPDYEMPGVNGTMGFKVNF